MAPSAAAAGAPGAPGGPAADTVGDTLRKRTGAPRVDEKGGQQGEAAARPGEGGMKKGGPEEDGGALRAALFAVASTAAWMFFSSALIILNKSLYRRGFAYPSLVTGMGQLFSALSGLLLAAAGAQPLRPPPGPAAFATKLLPLTACSAATMYTGNMAYLHLSVAFIQILKAFTPALTLLCCMAARLERLTPSLAVSVAMIAAGTAGAVLLESGTPAFSLFGFAAFMASSLTEAARVVGSQLLMKDDRPYNTAEQLVYVGGPTALVLLVGGLVWEGPALLEATWAYGGLELADPWVFLAAFAMSALVNMSCFVAIQATSSLTFKVAGCIKNLAVVMYGVAAHGEAVSALQLLGYGLSVAGFALYSRAKMGGGGGGGKGGTAKSA